MKYDIIRPIDRAAEFAELVEDLALPEIAPVFSFYEQCPEHGGRFISVPRNVGEASEYTAKCVWRFCGRGIRKLGL